MAATMMVTPNFSLSSITGESDLGDGIQKDLKEKNMPFKYAWARIVQQHKLDEGWTNVRKRNTLPDSGEAFIPIPGEGLETGIPAQIPSGLLLDPKIIQPPKDPKSIKVGIVGAGAAGMFTGMILNFLNNKKEVKEAGLHIDYDILEANTKDRVGGRLFTYEFPKHPDCPNAKHQYYDVGAMRFPQNNVMTRTFDLFDELGMKTIKYIMKDTDHQPYYYNDIQRFGPYEPSKDPDPYKLNADFHGETEMIDEKLMAIGPDDVIKNVLLDLKLQLAHDIEKNKEEGWKTLMAADFRSTRNFLCYPYKNKEDKYVFPDDLKMYRGLGYNFNTATWLETFEYGTGWYDQSLAETVLESLDFDYPEEEDKEKKEDKKKKEIEWRCIDGGAQRIARRMRIKLKQGKVPMNQEPAAEEPTEEEIEKEDPIEFQKVVTKIQRLIYKASDPKPQGVPDASHDMLVHVKGEQEPRRYFAVFNSTTLGAMQKMDLTQAGLTYGTKQAIRCLGYGASCKVAMRFKTKWWMDKERPYNITGGLAHTDMPLRVCVYPSYNIHDPDNEHAVLLVSYTWAQDAQRIGALITTPELANIKPEDKYKTEEELKDLLLRNLARLHTKTEPTGKDDLTYDQTLEMLNEQYIDHHAWDWYADRHMSGAFAYFGPGQFSNMWPEICRPNGKLWIIGEAASAHHAWVVGALESSVRAVWQMLYELYKSTGENEPAYKLAMDALECPKNKPYGPLPLYVTKEQNKLDCILGLLENKLELSSEVK